MLLSPNLTNIEECDNVTNCKVTLSLVWCNPLHNTRCGELRKYLSSIPQPQGNVQSKQIPAEEKVCLFDIKLCLILEKGYLGHLLLFRIENYSTTLVLLLFVLNLLT